MWRKDTSENNSTTDWVFILHLCCKCYTIVIYNRRVVLTGNFLSYYDLNNHNLQFTRFVALVPLVTSVHFSLEAFRLIQSIPRTCSKLYWIYNLRSGIKDNNTYQKSLASSKGFWDKNLSH